MARRLAGMDISSTAVKVAEFERGADGPRLQHLALRKHEDAGGIAAVPGFAELKEAEILAHPRVATIPFPDPPKVEFLRLPATSSTREMAAAVCAEIAMAHDLAEDEVVADFEVAGGMDQDGTTRVMAVFSRGSEIREMFTACRGAGLDLQALDAPELALGATLLANYDFEPNEPAVAVELGNTRSFLVLLVGGEVKFTRVLGVSGRELCNLLEDSFDFGDTPVEEYLVKCKVFPRSEQNLTDRNVLSLAAESFAEKIMSEIRLAVDFCLLNLSDEEHVGDLKRIYLSGGVAKLDGLDTYLADALSIEAEVLDPLGRIEFDFSVLDDLGMEQVPEFSVAIGLALRKEGIQ